MFEYRAQTIENVSLTNAALSITYSLATIFKVLAFIANKNIHWQVSQTYLEEKLKADQFPQTSARKHL